MMQTLAAAGAIAAINVPFGYWRASVRKFSWAWFLAVHVPVPIAIGLRMAMGIGLHLSTVPVFVVAFFSGQALGAAVHARRARGRHAEASRTSFHRSTLAALFCLGVAGTQTFAFAQATPRQLTVEYLTDPSAVDDPAPRLGWQLTPTDGMRGERQTAYRILVASSREALTREHGDLWDSGKVASAQTTHVTYAGRPLQPHEQVFWTVQAWDAADRASAWSAESTWTSGVQHASNWTAEWIAARPRPLSPPIWQNRRWLSGGGDEPFVRATRVYRARITLPARTRFQQTLLRFAAEHGETKVYVDGRFILAPQRPGFVETTDLTGYLSAGTHLIAIAVLSNQHAPLDRPGPHAPLRLVAEVVATGASGAPTILPLTAQTRTMVFRHDTLPNDWMRPAFVDADWDHARAHRHTATLRAFEDTLAPATYLRKTFTVTRTPRRAILYGTALGNYELHLNGQRVGRDHFTPGYTDYTRTLYYNAYDVTSSIRPGLNALGAIVADGWYAGYLGYMKRRDTFGSRHAVSAMLEVEFEDGTRQRIVTDETWKASDGPIRFADHLNGASWDGRRAMPQWASASFRDDTWTAVDRVARPSAHLSAFPGVPVRTMQTVAPRAITQPLPGVYVVDFGQNLVGWVRVRLSSHAGRTVVLRHGEMLNGDGTIYTENLRSARATDVFRLASDDETIEPAFTFHGFRYVQVSGLTAPPVAADWSALVVHSNLRETGAFASSNALVNQIFANTVWSQRGNYVDVPTDCPQRDERLGWMGDAQVFARTASYNMDIAAFMTKWLVDVRDAQLPEGAFSDIAPRVPDAPGPGAPGWGDAGVIVPWTLYQQYGDRRMLERHYDAMTRWIAWVDEGNPDHLWTHRVGNNYGDWLSPEGEGTKALYATAYFAYSTDLVSRIATRLGRHDDALRYTALRDRIRTAFVSRYLSADDVLTGDTQTAYLLALRFELVPVARRQALAERLLARLDAAGRHLGTGFLGVNILLPTLSDIDRDDRAYDILTRTTFPSWGYSIANGATTMWERWNSYTKADGFGDTGMNSFNHYAYGSVVEWLYTRVLGIEPLAPGFSRMRIAPKLGAPLEWARGHYDSVHGRIGSAWRIEGDRLSFDVEVPPNTVAEVHLPTPEAAAVTESGQPALSARGVTLVRSDGRVVVFEVGSGHYRFVAPR